MPDGWMAQVALVLMAGIWLVAARRLWRTHRWDAWVALLIATGAVALAYGIGVGNPLDGGSVSTLE